MLLALGLFIIVFGAVSAVGYFQYARPARFNQQLDSIVVADQPAVSLDANAAPEQKWFVRVVQSIGEKVPISPQDATMTRRLLIAAGYRTERAQKIFTGTKVTLGVIMFIAAVILYPRIDNPVLDKLALVALPAGGFFFPNLILDKMVGRRQERIRFALPDALDLMVVCMEAGLGLDQAIASVSRELKATHPDISAELGLVTLEMRAGKRRMDALKNLADRSSETELRKLVATMIQADRFGTSVAESLRTHSDFMRVKRRQEAEERAAKVGVKLVFPIFLFILPSMLLVAAGPGLLQLFKNLFPMMNSFGS